NGDKIAVRKDVPMHMRDVNLATLLHGTSGAVYAFTNLESDADRDVVLGVFVTSPLRVWLRGMPILQLPDDRQFHRMGGELVRVKLLKGNNPLLVKLIDPMSLAARIFTPEFAPVEGVQVKP